MPLDKSCSLGAFKANVRSAYKEGKTAKGTQHVAIALSTLKRSCGVSDDDRKMSPKEIVAAGPKGESLVRLSSIFERSETGSGSEVTPEAQLAWAKWLRRVEASASGAKKEASGWRVGPHTRDLIAAIMDFAGRRVQVPAYTEETGRDLWISWLDRVQEYAAHGQEEALAEALVEYLDGQVRGPKLPPFSAMMEKFGIDFAVRGYPRGTGISPNAATARPQDGGAFRVYADGGEIKTGDGRMPKVSKPRLPKRKP